MGETRPRLLVIGAGVNGSLCAVRLFQAGADVSLLARGARVAQLRRDGVVLEDPFTGAHTIARVPVLEELLPDDVYDYVLVVVRRNQVDALLPALARNRSPCVVMMVNTVTGPQAWSQALGPGRLLLGFVFGAGRREGDLVRVMQLRRGRTPFGEPDGTLSPRLLRLVELLRAAGLGACESPDLPDWLATHAAMVAPLAVAILAHRSDTYALARSPAELRALAGAMRETVAVLRATGHRVVPRPLALLPWVPRGLLVLALRRLLGSRYGEVGAGWHCSQAPDELNQLAADVRELVLRSGLAVPELRALLGLPPALPSAAPA